MSLSRYFSEYTSGQPTMVVFRSLRRQTMYVALCSDIRPAILFIMTMGVISMLPGRASKWKRWSPMRRTTRIVTLMSFFVHSWIFISVVLTWEVRQWCVPGPKDPWPNPPLQYLQTGYRNSMPKHSSSLATLAPPSESAGLMHPAGPSSTFVSRLARPRTSSNLYMTLILHRAKRWTLAIEDADLTTAVVLFPSKLCPLFLHLSTIPLSWEGKNKGVSC